MDKEQIEVLNSEIYEQSNYIKGVTLKAEKRIKKTLKYIEELKDACGVETDKRVVKQLKKITESLELVHGLINTVIDDSEEITEELKE